MPEKETADGAAQGSKINAATNIGRRRFVGMVTAAGLAGLAGCTGGDSSESTSPDSSNESPDSGASGNSGESSTRAFVRGKGSIPHTMEDFDNNALTQASSGPNSESGIEWNWSTESYSPLVGAYFQNGRTFALTDEFFAALGRDGSSLWKRELAGESGPLYRNDVIIGQANGQLVGLDPETGEEVWVRSPSSVATFDDADNLKLVGEIESGLVFRDGQRVLIYDSEADEAVLQGELSVPPNRMFAGEQAFFGMTRDALYAFSRDDLTQMWKVGVYGWPVAFHQDGTVYTLGMESGATTQQLAAIDAETGDINWKKTSDQPISPLAADAERLYVKRKDGTELAALDPTSGEQRWKAPLLNKINGWMSVTSERLFVGRKSTDSNGKVMSIDATSGEKLAEIDIGEMYPAHGTVVGDRLYVSERASGTGGPQANIIAIGVSPDTPTPTS